MSGRHPELGAGHPDSLPAHLLYDCGGTGHGPNVSEVPWCHDCTPHPTHLRPDTVTRLLGWIDRRLADIESELGDSESMQSRGLHGTAVLHERRDTLKFMRAQIEQDR